MSEPWLDGVRGEQVKPLITSDERFIRTEAGPGTGKTFGLVRRVQRILHPDGLGVSGKKVLVVAFNRVIAKQLEEDITKCLEKANFQGDSPIIRTIHGLCVEVANVTRLLLPHEEEAMVYDVLEANPALRQQYSRHDKAQHALWEHEAKHAQHPGLWSACRGWLTRHKANLINDLPSLLVDRLKAGDLPDYRYKHIIVDEFQDLTPGEQQLVFRLLESDGSLVALGDPRQSIYHFRGNDLQGLSKLEELVGEAIFDVPMRECQRCPKSIVEAANRLMVNHSAAPMTPLKMEEANIHVVVWHTLKKEIEGMANAITEHVANHPNDKHLVMVTRRAYGYQLREKLMEINPKIDIQLSFSESPLETWPAREAFLLFSLLCDSDPATWRAWFSYCSGDSFKAPSRNAPAYLALLEASGDSISEETLEQLRDGLLAIRGNGVGNIRERTERYFELKSQHQAEDDPSNLIDALFDSNKWIANENGNSNVARTDLELLRQAAQQALEEYSTESQDHQESEDLLRKVARRLRGQIATREPLSTESMTHLEVATLWSAKGVTADHVYVLGVNDEMIPGTRRLDYPGTDLEYLNEQQRLFYVTITRSKDTLVLSRSHKIKQGDAGPLGVTVKNPTNRWPELEMSTFVREITEHLPDASQGDDWRGANS